MSGVSGWEGCVAGGGYALIAESSRMGTAGLSGIVAPIFLWNYGCMRNLVRKR